MTHYAIYIMPEKDRWPRSNDGPEWMMAQNERWPRMDDGPEGSMAQKHFSLKANEIYDSSDGDQCRDYH